MRRLLFAAAASLAALGADAQVITTCGGSAGIAYFVPGGLVPQDQSGWQQDSITGGGIILTARQDKPQLLYRDATNRIRDAEGDDGAVVQWLSRSDPYVVMVVRKYTLEHYLFNIDASGSGEVVWTSFRFAGPIVKSGVYRAECRRP